MASQVAQLLEASLSPDAATRQGATTALQDLAASNFAYYLDALANELASAASPSHIRNSAGLALKNALTAKEATTQDLFAARWRELELGVRDKVKASTLNTLPSSDRSARNVAGQVIAAVAAIDVPQAQWPDLIPSLIALAGTPDQPALRQSSLQTIGYVCEVIKPELLAAQSNQILTAVVQGARKEEPSPEVQLAAVTALLNSLEFIRANFEREGERNYIMQVICEDTQSPSADVQAAAFECLVRIMQLYYDHMQFYMERALFGLTVLGMKHEDERVALQAVEFWSTICEEEIELAIQAEDAAEFEEPADRESRHFARVALPQVLPVLLQLLSKQEEDATDDEWNVSMAAGTCLALLAQAVGDGIVTPIIPFVERNIKNDDWHLREAAVMAFGSILDGPDPKLLVPLVTQALPTLLEMMRDPDVHVKDTTAWTLGRISDVLVQTIKHDTHLPGLVNAFIQGLDDSPRVVSNCCWGLMNLAENLGDPSADSSPLSPFCEPIADSLLRFAERGTTEPNARTPGYEALAALVNNAPNCNLPTVERVAVIAIERAEQMQRLANQLVGADDKNTYYEVQANLCSLLTSVVRRLGPKVRALSDRVMTLLLQIIQTSSKQSPVLEDAFLCIGSLTSTLEHDFQPYLQAFLPMLLSALQSHEEYQLCSIAVGLIGDICRALGEDSLPYCHGFMDVLLANLQSTVLHRNVKPPILSCFGDIALAIGASYEPFLATAMTVLQQAGAMRADPTNFDLVDYIIQLRESILEAYTGIITAFKSASRADLLLPHLTAIFAFLQLVLTDQDRTENIIKQAVGILGDLAEAFPSGHLKTLLQAPWVADGIKSAKQRMTTAEGRAIGKWAKEMVRRASQ